MTQAKFPLRRLSLALCASVLAGASPRAHASTNLFNVYLGAGLGHADLRARSPSLIASDPDALGTFDRHDMAYQFAAGVRGLYLLGAELDYMHLGSGSVSPAWAGIGSLGSARVSQKGAAAFALLYLPIPVPMLDVYLKAGVARITSDLSASAVVPGCTGTLCTCTVTCPNQTDNGSFGMTETTFAEGAGVQWSIGNWAVRGEYERFDALGEHPDLLTVGVTWSLL